MTSIWVLGVFAAFAVRSPASMPRDVEVVVEIDLSDSGQPMGTLFEMGDAAGLWLGAGFTYANNSRQPTSSTAVTFTARSRDRTVRVHDLGAPFEPATSFHLLVVEGELVAVPSLSSSLLPKYYDPETMVWSVFPAADAATVALRPSFTSVDGEALEIVGDGLWYASRPVSGVGDWNGGRPMNAMYVDGMLYVYVEYLDPVGAVVDGGFTVCSWRPAETIEGCSEHRFGHPFWFYTWVPGFRPGALTVFGSRGEVVDVSANGIEIQEGATTDSSQMYSAIVFNDRWLLGHYPSGNLAYYDEDGVAFMDPPIGSQPCSSRGQREAQSIGIWGGDLVVGMWPWGEIWVGRPGDEWTLAARVFTKPEVCGEAPYEALVSDHSEFEYNALGQRIFGMTSWSSGLAVATSMKHDAWAGALALIDEDDRAEYGRVYLLERDYEITCQLVDLGNTRLEFRLTAEEMTVTQDGEEICSRRVDRADIEFLGGEVIFGHGAWGRFSGEMSHHEVGL